MSSKMTGVALLLVLTSTLSPGTAVCQEPVPLSPRYDRGLTLASSDGDLEIRFQGRLHLHWTAWNNDSAMEDSGKAAQDGFYFRRARIKISGKLNDNIRFKLQPDFSGGATKIDTAHIQIDGLLPLGTFRVGKLVEPFGLDTLTSSNDSLFVERSSGKDAISPDKNIGFLIGDSWRDSKGTWSIGGFRDGTGSEGDSFGDNDLSWTGRVTWLPIDNKKEKRLLHLGLAGSFRKPPGGSTRFSARPEARPSEKLLDTGIIQGVSSVHLVGLETAWFEGPFALQGEQMFATTQRDSDSDRHFLHYHVSASYFLTGEQREYSRKKGIPSGVTPLTNWREDGGSGALQVVGRYSYTDLEDGGIDGGVLEQVTLGLNWYLDPATRILLDHVWVSASPIAGTAIDGSSDALALRFQIAF